MRALGLVVVSSVLSACAASPAPASPANAPATSGPAGSPTAATPPRRSGRLAPEKIQGAVRARFDQLRTCYERNLARDPEATGTVKVRFEIGLDGRVARIASAFTGTLAPEVATCMEAVFASIAFPAPEGGIVTVTYPVVLTPG